MSNALTRAARPLVLDASAKAVLMALCDMAREPDDRDRPCEAWPPMHGQDGAIGLCDWTCLGERAVQLAVKRLVASGMIARRQLRHGVHYTVLLLTPAPSTGVPDTGVANTGVPDAVTPAANAPKALPSTNRRKKASPSPSTRAIDAMPDLPPEVPAASWNDYVALRLAMAKGPKPKPWSASTARKAIAKLQALAADGNDPGAVLDQSVLNSWQGLFPVRDDRGRGAVSGPIEARRRARAGNGLLDAVIDAERRSGWAPRPGMEGIEPAALDDDDDPAIPF